MGLLVKWQVTQKDYIESLKSQIETARVQLLEAHARYQAEIYELRKENHELLKQITGCKGHNTIAPADLISSAPIQRKQIARAIREYEAAHVIKEDN